MDSLLTRCDLHVHLAGTFYAEDVLQIGHAIYREVEWYGQDFLPSYRALIDPDFDPIRLFETAVHHPATALQQLKAAYVFGEQDHDNFMRFMWKFRFFSRFWGTLWERPSYHQAQQTVRQTLARSRAQGIAYAEYRCGFWGETAVQMRRIKACIAALTAVSDATFTAKYITSIPRDATSHEHLHMLTTLLQQTPHLAQTLVGVDFAGIEEGSPPKQQRPFFQKLHAFNQQQPHLRLDAVYHVGETYYDKSLESAVRWCHEAALLGCQRLGHCIALGLDPAISLARRPQAHEAERVSERLDQIAYDLHYGRQLTAYGIAIDTANLQNEQAVLQKRDAAALVERPYSPQRLREVRARQQFVLNQFIQLGTVIECCPTSNLRIGGVPDAAHHPIHTFLRSRVNLAICTDDPGIFDITLADEIDWVLRHTAFTPDTLQQRLGDPLRFRLGQKRPFVTNA